jgi:tetratricopeptide (TPR) repeat protein
VAGGQGNPKAHKEKNMINFLVILAVMMLSLGANPALGQTSPKLWKLRQEVASNPQDPQAHLALGLKYESQGDNQKALREYKKVVQLKPDDVKGLYSLGRLMATLGPPGPAIKVIKEALKVDPKFVPARNLLASTYNKQGIALMQQGRLEDARQSLESGLKAQGGPDETKSLLNNLGCLYIRQNHLVEAIGTFQSLLRQDPNVAQAHYNLALIYYSQGEYQMASQQFYALKGVDPQMAGELGDYRFRIATPMNYEPPVKTMLTFKGSPLLTQGTIPSEFR